MARPLALSGQRRELAFAALFLVVWIGAPFWRIATLRAVNIQDDIYASDLWNDRLPARAFVGRTIARGELPLWTPGIYTGFPALADVEFGALYPSNLLLFGSLPPYVAFAYAQLLPLFLAGLGVHLLARRLGIGRGGALLASGAFALSGFFVCHLRQLNMIDAACWIPFVLLGVEKLLATPRAPALAMLALVWAVQCLAGHPQISYFTALALVPYTVARWRMVGAGETGRGMVGGVRGFVTDGSVFAILLAVALGTVIAAIQLLPGLELAALSHRRGGFPYEQAAAFPAAAGSALTFLIPYWNGDPATDTFRGSGLFWEQYGYVGLLPFLLAIAAVVVRRRDPVVRFLAGGAVVAHLLALGGNTPVFAIAFHAIPGMSHFRFPTRFLVFVELALALLAGLGLDLVAERLRARNLAGAAVAFVLGITAADLWAHQMRQVPQADWSAWTAPTGTERFLEQRRAEASEPWRYHSLDAQWVHAQTFHAAHGWAGDLAPYVWLRALLQPSFNLLGELESADGYANLVPRHYESVWGSEKEPGLVIPSGRSEGGEWRLRPEVLKCLRLFNVRYVLAPWPVSSPGIAPATRSAEGIHVHEVLDPLPRAFVVGGTRRAADAGEALRLLVAPDFDPAAEAIVTDDVALPPGSGASRSVSFARPSATSVELRAVLDRPGLLVVSEGTHPGWRATVDGIAAPILRVNVMMRGVVLTAGAHRVTFEFRPRSVEIGALASLAGLTLLAAVLVVPRLRRHAEPVQSMLATTTRSA